MYGQVSQYSRDTHVLDLYTDVYCVCNDADEQNLHLRKQNQLCFKNSGTTIVGI